MIYCPSNRSKQIKETHTANSTSTQYTRQSLNEKQHTWLHKQKAIGCEAMYVVFHSNFAAYIVCRRFKRCEFPGFVWTDCWGNKSYYVITSPANIRSSAKKVKPHLAMTEMMTKKKKKKKKKSASEGVDNDYVYHCNVSNVYNVHNDQCSDNVCSSKSNRKHSRIHKNVRRGNRKKRSCKKGNNKGIPIIKQSV